MRLLCQRVRNAQVKTLKYGKVIGKIGKGIFVLVGVKKGDTTENANILASKLSKLRIMSDENDSPAMRGRKVSRAGKMNLSVNDVGGQMLVVSQFTLYANTSGGNRPSFINAALPEEARKIYNFFIEKLKSEHIKVETGSFGDYMQISAELDGPVTIILEN